MDDACVIVRVIERVAKLTDPVGQFGRLKNLVRLVGAQIGKGVAIDVFHGDATRRFIMNEIVNADDVFVRELEAAPCFAFQVAKHGVVMDDQVGQKFERDVQL